MTDTQHTQHTPGPWVFDLSKSWRPHRVSLCHFVGNDDADIAHIGENFSSNRSPAETIANARLIAAAPDLLASLERLVTLMNIVGDEPFRNGVTDSTGSMDEGIVIASKWLHEARAAIAKATGK